MIDKGIKGTPQIRNQEMVVSGHGKQINSQTSNAQIK